MYNLSAICLISSSTTEIRTVQTKHRLKKSNCYHNISFNVRQAFRVQMDIETEKLI